MNPPANAGDMSLIPGSGQEDPLEEGTETYFSILAWEIPWTEEPGGLPSMGSQKVGHDRVTEYISLSQRSETVHLASHSVSGLARELSPPPPPPWFENNYLNLGAHRLVGQAPGAPQTIHSK